MGASQEEEKKQPLLHTVDHLSFFPRLFHYSISFTHIVYLSISLLEYIFVYLLCFFWLLLLLWKPGYMSRQIFSVGIHSVWCVHFRNSLIIINDFVRCHVFVLFGHTQPTTRAQSQPKILLAHTTK